MLKSNYSYVLEKAAQSLQFERNQPVVAQIKLCTYLYFHCAFGSKELHTVLEVMSTMFVTGGSVIGYIIIIIRIITSVLV